MYLTKDQYKNLTSKIDIKNPDLIDKKIDSLCQVLDFSKENIIKIILRYPKIIQYSISAITEKMEQVKIALSLTEKQCLTIFKIYPNLLTSSAKQLITNYYIYMNKLDLNSDTIKDFIVDRPRVLSINKLDKRINLLYKNGFDANDIIKHSFLLFISPQLLLSNLAICKYFHLNINDFLDNLLYKMNKDELFARLSTLKSSHTYVYKHIDQLKSSKFAQNYGSDYKKYKITQEVEEKLKKIVIEEDNNNKIDENSIL